MRSARPKKYMNKNKLLFILVLLLLLFILEKTNIINIYSKKIPDTNSSEAKTTSTAPSAQENFTDGNDRQPLGTNRNEGVVTDTGGNISNTPDKDKWLTSSDGAITVYSPLENTTVTNGSSMSGTSIKPSVSFRLIDDVSGVIAQGTLTVVNGKFSGTFNFSTTGTNGRLDIFFVKDDGAEASIVEIPIRFR